MWTKNGSETLPLVLKRIDEVIPRGAVNRRVVVDDRSSDNTREIAQDFGWDVILNEGSGISDGANTALRQVESEYFVSFEQDLVLAADWWQKIPKYLSNHKIAVASGVRLPNQPSVVRKIQEYSLERNERGDKTDTFLYGKTLDNTIYKTDVIKKIGGFPKLSISAGVDNILAQEVDVAKFDWKVDYSVRSIHLRKSLRQELAHDYWYGTCYSTLNPLLFKHPVKLRPMVIRVFFSPIRGLEIALKKKAPEAIYAYPLMRFTTLKGIYDGLKRA